MDLAYVPTAKKDNELANKFAKKGLAYLKRCGLPFYALVYTSDGLLTDNSPSLHDFGELWLDASRSVPAALRKSHTCSERVKFLVSEGTLGDTFDSLALPVQRSLVGGLLKAVIPDLKNRFPYASSKRPQEDVVRELREAHGWYPGGVDWLSPLSMNCEQLQGVFDSLAEHLLDHSGSALLDKFNIATRRGWVELGEPDLTHVHLVLLAKGRRGAAGAPFLVLAVMTAVALRCKSLFASYIVCVCVCVHAQ
jgi:hypothetical protein